MFLCILYNMAASETQDTKIRKTVPPFLCITAGFHNPFLMNLRRRKVDITMLTGTVLAANTNISHLSALLQPQDILRTILFIAHECNDQTCMVRNLRP